MRPQVQGPCADSCLRCFRQWLPPIGPARPEPAPRIPECFPARLLSSSTSRLVKLVQTSSAISSTEGEETIAVAMASASRLRSGCFLSRLRSTAASSSAPNRSSIPIVAGFRLLSVCVGAGLLRLFFVGVTGLPVFFVQSCEKQGFLQTPALARWNGIHHDRLTGGSGPCCLAGSLERGHFGPSTLREVCVQKVTRGCRSVNSSKWREACSRIAAPRHLLNLRPLRVTQMLGHRI